MAQTDEKIRTINLEPLGLKKEVTVDEVSNAATNIYNELKNLGKNSSERSIEVEEPQKPAVNTGKLKTYGIYTVGGLIAVYLIGKALE